MISKNLSHLSDGFEKLFSTPSLMKGEDPDVYDELYEQVEEVLKPQDVWDQMMVADIANHFWEQQRIRRCTGGVVNGKRREALTLILRSVVGHARVDAEWLADIYFGFNRAQESRLEFVSLQCCAYGQPREASEYARGRHRPTQRSRSR